MTTHGFIGLIPGIPLAGALIIFLGLPIVRSKKYLRFIARFSIIASVLFTSISLFHLYVLQPDRSYLVFTFNKWFYGDQVRLLMSLYASPFSLLPLLFIGLFTLFLIVFLSNRQRDEHHELRLTRYVVLLYALSAILLVSGSFLLTFFAWSVIGIVMFIMTHDRFLTTENHDKNRLILMRFLVFDFMFLMGLILLLGQYKTLEYHQILRMGQVRSASPLMWRMILAGILMLVGIGGRLPLFPFSGWLMQTKKIPRIIQLYLFTSILPLGIYLILRLSFFFNQSPVLLVVLGSMGGLSVIYGGLSILLQTNRNHLSPSVMLMLVGIAMFLASIGLVYYTYLTWLFTICLLPFILIPKGFAATDPVKEELSNLAEEQPGLYLAIRENFWLDAGLDWIFIQPLKKTATFIWSVDSWLDRLFSDGLGMIFRKWGELSLFFDTTLIAGFPGETGHGLGNGFFRVFKNREFYTYLVLIFCVIFVLAICVILI